MFILFLLAIVLSILLRFTDSDYPFGTQGRIQGAHPARATPKIGKNMIFWRKIVIFTISRHPPLGAIFLNAPPLT
jgi:hypothetical protein